MIRKKKIFCLLNSVILCIALAGCGSDREFGHALQSGTRSGAESQIGSGDESNDTDTGYTETNQSKETEEKRPEETFELTDKGKLFLTDMCLYVPDFAGEDDMNTDFWKNFLFSSYTRMLDPDVEHIDLFREDIGMENVCKVSLEKAEKYAELAFGLELPDLKPAFEEMNNGQTAFYYQDGYYYIGSSDFPDLQYTYKNSTVLEEKDRTFAIVEYSITFEGEENFGAVSFHLYPDDNANGFIIGSKATEIAQVVS